MATIWPYGGLTIDKPCTVAPNPPPPPLAAPRRVHRAAPAAAGSAAPEAVAVAAAPRAPAAAHRPLRLRRRRRSDGTSGPRCPSRSRDPRIPSAAPRDRAARCTRCTRARRTCAVSGSYAEPGQLTPPLSVPDVSARERSFDLADERRQEHRAEPIALRGFEALRLELRREVDQIALDDAVARVRRRLGRERLRRVVFSPGTSVCGTGRSSIGHTG